MNAFAKSCLVLAGLAVFLVAPAAAVAQANGVDQDLIQGTDSTSGRANDGTYCPILNSLSSASEFAKRARKYAEENKLVESCLHWKIAHCIEKTSMTFEGGYTSCMSQCGAVCKDVASNPCHPCTAPKYQEAVKEIGKRSLALMHILEDGFNCQVKIGADQVKEMAELESKAKAIAELNPWYMTCNEGAEGFQDQQLVGPFVNGYARQKYDECVQKALNASASYLEKHLQTARELKLQAMSHNPSTNLLQLDAKLDAYRQVDNAARFVLLFKPEDAPAKAGLAEAQTFIQKEYEAQKKKVLAAVVWPKGVKSPPAEVAKSAKALYEADSENVIRRLGLRKSWYVTQGKDDKGKAMEFKCIDLWGGWETPQKVCWVGTMSLCQKRYVGKGAWSSYYFGDLEGEYQIGCDKVSK